jgi:hypothetical protein
VGEGEEGGRREEKLKEAFYKPVLNLETNFFSNSGK